MLCQQKLLCAIWLSTALLSVVCANVVCRMLVSKRRSNFANIEVAEVQLLIVYLVGSFRFSSPLLQKLFCSYA
ncbi:hypothetical protein Peur_070625 [Populus x canadensis]